ncbi:hypothetical protein NE237_009609 [Protea cynaroides]|uniref:ABC1 atypical kinase-like domain-containing protein n=1 Tax=Protea cynaroides TaxID=273540 RepID=A0A9Q0KY95_9MAGN|nr:hypothetical protein NE237_009609 [Protea cynaroides]
MLRNIITALTKLQLFLLKKFKLLYVRGSKEYVVIKVLKPGVEDILVADLNCVYVVARILEFLNPELSRASLNDIVEDIKDSMLKEVNFKKEAVNIEAFRTPGGI